MIRYRNKAGIPVSGVTTIIGKYEAKPFLIAWSSKMCSEYILNKLISLDEFSTEKLTEICTDGKSAHIKKRDGRADSGTLAHDFVSNYLLDIEPPSTEGLPEQVIAEADVCFRKFLQWEQDHDFRVQESEMSLVSEENQYGGTIDIYGSLDVRGTRQNVLIDIKTSKQIYRDSHCLQVAGGYTPLLEEHGFNVDSEYILLISPVGKKYQFKAIRGRQCYREKFKYMLEMHQIDNKLKDFMRDDNWC